jgi:hypothetical protein
MDPEVGVKEKTSMSNLKVGWVMVRVKRKDIAGLLEDITV